VTCDDIVSSGASSAVLCDVSPLSCPGVGARVISSEDLINEVVTERRVCSRVGLHPSRWPSSMLLETSARIAGCSNVTPPSGQALNHVDVVPGRNLHENGGGV
jgi:hypothetical protein